MAPTFRHGKGASARVLVATTTYIISSGTRSVKMSRKADTSDVTTYGDNDRNFLAGLMSGEFSVSGIFASTYEAISAALGSTSTITFKFDPHGATTGRTRYQASVIMTSFDVSAAVDGNVEMEMSFMRSGALTATTVP